MAEAEIRVSLVDDVTDRADRVRKSLDSIGNAGKRQLGQGEDALRKELALLERYAGRLNAARAKAGQGLIPLQGGLLNGLSGGQLQSRMASLLESDSRLMSSYMRRLSTRFGAALKPVESEMSGAFARSVEAGLFAGLRNVLRRAPGGRFLAAALGGGRGGGGGGLIGGLGGMSPFAGRFLAGGAIGLGATAGVGALGYLGYAAYRDDQFRREQVWLRRALGGDRDAIAGSRSITNRLIAGGGMEQRDALAVQTQAARLGVDGRAFGSTVDDIVRAELAPGMSRTQVGGAMAQLMHLFKDKNFRRVGDVVATAGRGGMSVSDQLRFLGSTATSVRSYGASATGALGFAGGLQDVMDPSQSASVYNRLLPLIANLHKMGGAGQAAFAALGLGSASDYAARFRAAKSETERDKMLLDVIRAASRNPRSMEIFERMGLNPAQMRVVAEHIDTITKRTDEMRQHHGNLATEVEKNSSAITKAWDRIKRGITDTVLTKELPNTTNAIAESLGKVADAIETIMTSSTGFLSFLDDWIGRLRKLAPLIPNLPILQWRGPGTVTPGSGGGSGGGGFTPSMPSPLRRQERPAGRQRSGAVTGEGVTPSVTGLLTTTPGAVATALNQPAGAEYIKQQRARLAAEMEADPQLRLRMAALLDLENPGAGPAVVESAFNRAIMTGRSLRSILSGGPNSFYGPARRGAVEPRMRQLERNPARLARLNSFIDQAINGSNAIQMHTDQGSRGDPNYVRGGLGININRERFNDWGGFKGVDYSRRWRMQQMERIRAHRTEGGIAYPESGSFFGATNSLTPAIPPWQQPIEPAKPKPMQDSLLGGGVTMHNQITVAGHADPNMQAERIGGSISRAGYSLLDGFNMNSTLT